MADPATPREGHPHHHTDSPLLMAARDLGQALQGIPMCCPLGALLTSLPPLLSPPSAPALPQGRPACGQPVDSKRPCTCHSWGHRATRRQPQVLPGCQDWGKETQTSSYLRSASSAMCFASFSCISWSSIFSSSFMALFSMTFMPLRKPQVRSYCHVSRWDLHLLTAHCTLSPLSSSSRDIQHCLGIPVLTGHSTESCHTSSTLRML